MKDAQHGAARPHGSTRPRRGGAWGNQGSPTQNDHGLLTWEPAIGRQKQRGPRLALPRPAAAAIMRHRADAVKRNRGWALPGGVSY
jgi:hypothetical protein